MTSSQKASLKTLKKIQENDKIVTTYMSTGDYEKLKKIAKMDDRSVSSIIRKALADFLQKEDR
jgi:predicted transcriptional regulator